MNGPTDAELMARTRDGDPDAFAMLVDRHKDALVNYLSRLTGSREQAEDTAQEAFVRVYSRAHRYDEQGKFAPYLFRIATNLVRSERRRLRAWRQLAFRLIRPDSDDSRPADTQLIGEEIRRHVDRALAELPVAYRAAVVLRDIEGWSYDEIAAAIGCAEGTVKSKINRGREELRKRLKEYWKGQEIDERRSFA
jgi:RNA polymerase sigma-70 factor (ECF subfamily)